MFQSGQQEQREAGSSSLEVANITETSFPSPRTGTDLSLRPSPRTGTDLSLQPSPRTGTVLSLQPSPQTGTDLSLRPSPRTGTDLSLRLVGRESVSAGRWPICGVFVPNVNNQGRYTCYRYRIVPYSMHSRYCIVKGNVWGSWGVKGP